MTTAIIDVSNMAYRARYSYSLSHNDKDTSVTYGVLRMLMSVVKDLRPTSVIMCFDGGRPLYRERLIQQYKSHRKHDDDETYQEFLRQVYELWRILPYFGVLCVRRAGIEADDLMYHASRMLDDTSMIITNDDDLLQSVDLWTSVYKPMKKGGYKQIGLVNFKEEVGVDPENFLQAKALLGDSSDNIPGVKGIGPVTMTNMFANGAEDLSILNDNLRRKVLEFYGSIYQSVITCIDLSHDLCGAKMALVNAFWMPYTKKRVYTYCFDNAFTSLIEAGSLGQLFGPLKQPTFVSGYRTPRIWDTKRSPW